MYTNNNSFFKFTNVVKTPCFFVIWAALTVLSYFYIDPKLAIFMDHHNQGVVQVIADILTKFGYSFYYLVGFTVLFLICKTIYKNRRLANISLFFLLSIIIPGLVCDILKMVLGRTRPNMLFDHHLYGFYFWKFHADMWSFPSGHATTIISIATVMSLLYPRFWLAFFSFAILVAASRIALTAHYLSDVMVGLYLGIIIVVWLNSRLRLLNYGGR